MSAARSPGPAVQRLTQYLVAAAPASDLAGELSGWLAESPRFRAFAEANRDKIRRKLRGATDAEARRDVRMEVAVARSLLADRRVDLVFEAYGSGRAGPDFTVAFRGERTFNLEVTRLRRGEATSVWGPLLAKLLQLPPSVPNALLLAIDGDDAGTVDVVATVHGLRARADRKDDAFFANRGFVGTRGFYDRFLRLSAAFVWAEAAAAGQRASVWSNTSARIPLVERVRRACLACLETA